MNINSDNSDINNNTEYYKYQEFNNLMHKYMILSTPTTRPKLDRTQNNRSGITLYIEPYDNNDDVPHHISMAYETEDYHADSTKTQNYQLQKLPETDVPEISLTELLDSE